MAEFFGEAISWLFIGLIFLCEIVRRCLVSPFFWIVLVAGVAWFVYASRHTKKIAEDEEKSNAFRHTKSICEIVFWIVLAVVCVLVNIFAGPMRFM